MQTKNAIFSNSGRLERLQTLLLLCGLDISRDEALLFAELAPGAQSFAGEAEWDFANTGLILVNKYMFIM